MSRFDEQAYYFHRWLAEKEPDWPEAVINLIDALRAYIRIDGAYAKDFLDDGSITREMYERSMRDLARMQNLLDQLEGAEVDCNLSGVIKSKP